MYGVKPETFNKMLIILQKEFNTMHKSGGKPPKLTPKDKLYVTLKYLRDYRTMDSIASEYKVCKGTICLSYTMGGRHFSERRYVRITEKRVLKKKSDTIEYIVVDVTESPINRPKNNQKEYYSGKKNAIR
ncbi:MAG: hypothetical protein FWC19_07610 [Treponema sp.]|nr:hypothetical protein [Treponema sp.]MCL2272647.1 hypothetical protein [Treponema sp.]